MNIKERLEQLNKKIGQLDWPQHWPRLTERCVNILQAKGVLGVDRLVQRLERCTKGSDRREYWEVLIEGWLAVALAYGNFIGIEVECSSSGPDIKAEWCGNTIYFEVTRKRSKVDEWGVPPEKIKLPSSEPEDILGKIQEKMRQLNDNEINIIVLCSSTIGVDRSVVEKAFELIQQEEKQNPGAYGKLSGVLFTEDGGLSIPSMKEYYLYKNENASKPIGPRLARKLRSLNTLSPQQLKQKREEWSNILKKKSTNQNL